MATKNKLKISWKNALQQSVVEKDVLKLRNQLKSIQSSHDLKMSDNRMNTQAREQNM